MPFFAQIGRLPGRLSRFYDHLQQDFLADLYSIRLFAGLQVGFSRPPRRLADSLTRRLANLLTRLAQPLSQTHGEKARKMCITHLKKMPFSEIFCSNRSTSRPAFTVL